MRLTVGGTIWAKWPKTAWKLQNRYFWSKQMGARGDKPIFRDSPPPPPPPVHPPPPLGESLLWSVKVIKQLAVPFTWTLSGVFTFLVYLIPLQFILLAVSLLDFVYVVLTAFCNRWWYFAFSIRCIFDVLSAKVSFFLMNAISLNLCVTSFENNFLLCGI